RSGYPARRLALAGRAVVRYEPSASNALTHIDYPQPAACSGFTFGRACCPHDFVTGGWRACGSFRGRSADVLDLLMQNRESGFHDVPNKEIVDIGVTVNQDVPEGNYSLVVGDSLC